MSEIFIWNLNVQNVSSIFSKHHTSSGYYYTICGLKITFDIYDINGPNIWIHRVKNVWVST